MKKDQDKPKGKQGGARPGSGRKPGTANKYSVSGILDEIQKQDKPFEQGLAEDYAKARRGDDKHLIQKYQAMIINKVVPDKADLTSNGETLGVTLNLAPKETGDHYE